MKKLSLFLMLAFALGMSAAESFCHKQLTAGSKHAYVTAKSVGENQYLLLIEADENMTGLGGSFIFVNGNEPYQLNTADHFVLSDDKRTITCDIQSTAAPKHYTPLYVLFENGGESNFGQPDADYSQTCEGGDEPSDPTDPDHTEPDKPEPGDPLSPYDPAFWTDIDWLGNGSGNEANTEMYKIHCAEGQQVANIQVAPWDDNNVGIYTWVEAGVNSVSVDAGIQGAGVLLHLDAFVNMVTEVIIQTGETSYLCHVFFKNGVDNTVPSDPSGDPDPVNPGSGLAENPMTPSAVKVICNGQMLIIRDGAGYTLVGTQVR